MLSVLSVMGHAFQRGCRNRHAHDYIVAVRPVFGSHGRWWEAIRLLEHWEGRLLKSVEEPEGCCSTSELPDRLRVYWAPVFFFGDEEAEGEWGIFPSSAEIKNEWIFRPVLLPLCALWRGQGKLILFFFNSVVVRWGRMAVGGHCEAFRSVDADARIWCTSYAKDCLWDAIQHQCRVYPRLMPSAYYFTFKNKTCCWERFRIL
jgi:hypothetical protein